MFRRLLLTLALLLGLVVPAAAQEDTQVFVVAGGGAPPSGYTGPGDVISYTAFWGLRAYSGAIVTTGTLALVNLTRASDSRSCDVIVSGTGGLGLTGNCSNGGDNGSTVTAWCTSTTCKLVTLYDQTGGGRNLTQAVSADQPTLIISCVNSLPCWQATSNVVTMVTAGSFTPATGKATLIVVAERISGTGGGLVQEAAAANRFLAVAANTWQTKVASGNTLNGTAADGAWHVGQGVINTAGGTVTNIDNAQTTGTANGNTTAGVAGFVGGSSSTIRWSELGFVDNVQATTTQQTSICDNAFTYWGTATSC